MSIKPEVPARAFAREVISLKLKKAGIITKLLIVALALYAVISIVTINGRVTQAQQDKSELQRQVDEMAQENAELQYQLDHSEDQETIEEIARNKLGLVLPGEKIFYDISE